MALDILHDNWGPYTHTEVENALKAYLTVLENRINQAIQSGGVGLADLSAEVQALLNKANTALQPENIAAWAKAQNKPGYTVSEITGVEGFQNLLAKLQDMDAKIQAAAASGGVDPDDEMSSTSEKPVQNKVIKAFVEAFVYQAISNLINGAPAALDTLKELADKLGDDDSAIAALTTTLAGKLGASDVSVSSNGGGAFNIVVGNNIYTISLLHTHEGMAKVVVDTPANLPNPANMDADTIYAALENGDITTIYLAGHPFNSSAPETGEARIIVPTPGSTLDMGADIGSGFSKTIQIRAKNISQALTIAISGTSGTWGINYGQLTGQSSITIPAADALLGVNIEITCTPSSDVVDEATLVISSTEITTTSLNLEAQNVSIVNLAAVKFTKQQYVETDIHTGPNTRLEIDMKFDGNYVIPDKVTTDVNFIGNGTDNGKTFSANVKSDVTRPGVVIYTETTSSNCTLNISSENIENRSTLIINNVSHQASFIGVSGTLPTKTTTMPAKMKFGSNSNGSKTFGAADIILYSLKHYENNVLTHEYLPQSRNGVAGLYDTVTNTFISSSTAVALEAVNS